MRYTVRSKMAKEFTSTFSRLYGVYFKGKVQIEVEEDGYRLYYINGEPSALEVEGWVIPTLSFRSVVDRLPRVVVDMGAISHICNGADVMAPGIVSSSVFTSGSVVVVVDERYGKPLAIGVAVVDSAAGLERGRVVKNLHYVGDAVWRRIKSFM